VSLLQQRSGLSSVIDILKSNFNILEGEGDQDIREKVKRGIEIMKIDEPQLLLIFWSFYQSR